MKVQHPHWGWQSYLPYSNGGYIEWKNNCWLEICLIKKFPFFLHLVTENGDSDKER